MVRLSPLFLLPILVMIVFIFLILTIDITDASFVPAIIKQEGFSYVVQAYATLLIGPIILAFLGLPACLVFPAKEMNGILLFKPSQNRPFLRQPKTFKIKLLSPFISLPIKMWFVSKAVSQLKSQIRSLHWVSRHSTF